ncbi:hypothetical protein B296_00058948 [Ensete ventricosum]|uniref:Uncharacterized protein n=1 Tax=Ensete ventricosum TaxID=4639 RepID=A0A426WZ66_ENSVE|nr:hypothetical protein B296_00058948 [Ensete ventricosum]
MTSTRSTRTWWRPARSKKTIEHPRSNIIMQREYGPQLTMPVLIPFFQQPTGINVIMFYAPVSFETVGFGDDASLPRAHRDHWPPIFLLVVGCRRPDCTGRGRQLAEDICERQEPLLVHLCRCCFRMVMAVLLAGWCPREIFPSEIRKAGRSITVSCNMLFTFITDEDGFWVLIMTLFIAFFLPRRRRRRQMPMRRMSTLETWI